MLAFSIASYNILADAYLRPKWFAHCQPEHLEPEPRRALLIDRLQGLDADVLCLQEVEPPTFQWLDERLRDQGYVGRYRQKGCGRPDGSAVYWRSRVFRLFSERKS